MPPEFAKTEAVAEQDAAESAESRARAALRIVTYHYVRDPDRTPFPGLKSLRPDRFRKQLVALKARYEMATLESALDFLAGKYQPARDLCLLTFDDGLKEHCEEVTPLLVDMGLEGLFFVITSSLEENTVASVHMNHLLMASMDFDAYERAFMQRLEDFSVTPDDCPKIDPAAAQKTYRFDEPRVAAFKYLLNFSLAPAIRDQVLKSVFAERLGRERSLAPALYLSWQDARRMQEAGMVLGGHSHLHTPLANLTDEELHRDLTLCMKLLALNLQPQTLWPFCYPYGTEDSFTRATAEKLQRLGFACSFSTGFGTNAPGCDLFSLRRIDCNDIKTGNDSKNGK